MANVKITQLEHISSSQLAPEDVFVVDDVSTLVTRKLTLANLIRYSGNAHAVQSNLTSYITISTANAAALANSIANFGSGGFALNIIGDAGTDTVQVGVDSLSFSGGVGLSSSISNNSVTFNLDNTSVAPGTYGGVGTTTVVPIITIDAQGRIVSASNASVSVDLSEVDSRLDNVESAIGNLINGTTTFTANLSVAGEVSANRYNVSGYGDIIDSTGAWIGPPSGLFGYTGSAGINGFTGSAGTIGIDGYVGSVGFTGSRGVDGFTGSAGFAGSVGFVGSKGDIGFSGSRGDLGYSGSQGVTGFSGSSGVQGVTGFTGSRGDTGFVGSFGATGFVGSQGVIGFSGSAGFVGSIGYSGSAGFTGSQGATGFVGSRGDLGYTGSIGFTGSLGAVGFTGSVGFVGSVGYTGSIGFSGSQGKITTDAAVPPTSPYQGQIWFDTESLKTYVYYDSFWVEVGGSDLGTLYTRSGFTATTSSIANNSSTNINITGYKSYVLMSVSTSHASWVRLYCDQASRTADESRPIYTDPLAGSGVIAEFITTGNQTIKVTPFIFGGNMETTPTDDLYIRVTNLSGSTAAISVSALLTRLEI